jgi:hypothetical protein
MAGNNNSDMPLGAHLLGEARWLGQDAYPATPEFRAELEELLKFLQLHKRLDSFWPRLTAPRITERDDALQEIRVARFLSSNGFPVAQWEPPGRGNYVGEFSIEASSSQPIFVEIKSPGWEGQLSQEQRDAGRAHEEKYQDLVGGPDDPWRAIRMSVRKAYPKFLTSQPNLLIIADDRFVPLATWGNLAAEQALLINNKALDDEAGYFTTNQFENLGGVALFKAEDEVLRGLQYTLLLFPNPKARAETALPNRFAETFAKAKTARKGV